MFVVGFIRNNYAPLTVPQLQLFITTSQLGPVHIKCESLLGFNNSYIATHDSTTVIQLNNSYQVLSGNDSNKGIRVSTRNMQISVFGLNYDSGTSDAFLAVPCSRQNVEEYVYYGIMFHGVHDRYSLRLSQLLIVGCEDNTTVTVASQTITLNMMETYLYERDQDLTGTRVVSNNPISLFSGHQCSFIPENIGFCDHLTEQLPNTATWGTRFLTASLAGRNTDDMYRILASQPSTIVTVTCSTQLQSNIYNLSSAGDWETIVIPGSNSSYCAIESSKPLLVVQFALGREIDSAGDPFMMIIPAIEQYDNDYNIFMPHEFSRHFVTVFVTPEYYQPDMIYIDDVSQEGAEWAVINCIDTTICGYATYAELPAGTHRLYHAGFRATIGVLVYGFNVRESYGYPGGLQLFPRASMYSCTD